MSSIQNLTLEGLFNYVVPTSSNTIKVLARKTINVKPYETEEFTAEVEVEIQEGLTNMERTVMIEILHISLEFSIYTQVYLRNLITQEDFLNRKQNMLDCIMTLCKKLEDIDPNSKLLSEIKKTIR